MVGWRAVTVSLRCGHPSHHHGTVRPKPSGALCRRSAALVTSNLERGIESELWRRIASVFRLIWPKFLPVGGVADHRGRPQNVGDLGFALKSRSNYFGLQPAGTAIRPPLGIPTLCGK